MTLPGSESGRPRVLAVELLSDSDYRHYWLGSTAFALGIWGFLVSMGVSARVLTDSPLRISLVPVAYFRPMFLLALPAGIVVYGPTSSTSVALARSSSPAHGNGLQRVLMRTLLMRITDSALHGRVLGTLMLTWGANVVGTLDGGLLAESLGVGPLMVLSGVLIAVAGAVLVARPFTWRL